MSNSIVLERDRRMESFRTRHTGRSREASSYG
jgi:hypothetical protein